MHPKVVTHSFAFSQCHLAALRFSLSSVRPCWGRGHWRPRCNSWIPSSWFLVGWHWNRLWPDACEGLEVAFLPLLIVRKRLIQRSLWPNCWLSAMQKPPSRQAWCQCSSRSTGPRARQNQHHHRRTHLPPLPFRLEPGYFDRRSAYRLITAVKSGYVCHLFWTQRGSLHQWLYHLICSEQLTAQVLDSYPDLVLWALAATHLPADYRVGPVR